jgi:hypothetical protein
VNPWIATIARIEAFRTLSHRREQPLDGCAADLIDERHRTRDLETALDVRRALTRWTARTDNY